MEEINYRYWTISIKIGSQNRLTWASWIKKAVKWVVVVN